MKRLFCLSLVVFASLFSGCMSNGSETIVLPEQESSHTAGYVPPSIIPDAIRGELENSMPIYSGTTPPDISGQYLANYLILAGSSLSYDDIGSHYMDNRPWADKYVAFIKESDGKLSYREKNGNGQSASDNVIVEIVGSGNNFTAYFESIGESDNISTRMSNFISGTLTSSGISDFHSAFIMLEKGPDPSNKLVAVNTYRVFKDGDNLAERYNWLNN